MIRGRARRKSSGHLPLRRRKDHFTSGRRFPKINKRTEKSHGPRFTPPTVSPKPDEGSWEPPLLTRAIETTRLENSAFNCSLPPSHRGAKPETVVFAVTSDPLLVDSPQPLPRFVA